MLVEGENELAVRLCEIFFLMKMIFIQMARGDLISVMRMVSAPSSSPDSSPMKLSFPPNIEKGLRVD